MILRGSLLLLRRVLWFANRVTHAHNYCNPDILVRLVQGGSSEAIDRITRCYGQRLLAAGNRYCRTQAESEDAVQETLLHATLHLGDFRAEGSLEGWLVRIVASACRRQSRGRKNDAALHESDEELQSHVPSPFDLSCRGELAQALQTALLELGPTDRLIVLLTEVEGWRAPEVAAELGLSSGAVRTRLARLRARLRRALTPLISSV